MLAVNDKGTFNPHQSIIGVVEDLAADRKHLNGWISYPSDGSEVRLTCVVDGDECGIAEFGAERLDVLSKLNLRNRRFTISVPRSLPPGLLIGSRVALVVDVCGEQRFGCMKLSTSLRKQEKTLLDEQPGLSVSSPVLPVKRRAPKDPSDLSPVLFPIGLTSAEGDAILGREGYLFLIGGSNDLLPLYSPPETDEQREEIAQVARCWATIFERRKTLSDRLGINYVQCIVPEKLTILRDLLDGPPRRTPLLTELEKQLKGLKFFSDVSKPFLQATDRKQFWPRNDTHLSPFGACSVMRLLFDALGLEHSVLSKERFERADLYKGDLSRRVFGIGLLEPQMGPIEGNLLIPGDAPELIEAIDPPGRGHIGTRRVWRRKSAPFDLRVVAFANSFFDTGDNPSRLSWWAARLFREFHFIWGPNFDPTYLETIRPDVVIGQTIERFLLRPART
jgi:hypothetical protein